MTVAEELKEIRENMKENDPSKLIKQMTEDGPIEIQPTEEDKVNYPELWRELEESEQDVIKARDTFKEAQKDHKEMYEKFVRTLNKEV